MLTPKFLKRAYDRLLRQDALDRDPPSPRAEQLATKALVPPGYVVRLSETEYIGSLPIGTFNNPIDFNTPIPLRVGPSEGEKEFAEHGSIALRIPASITGESWDNTIDNTWTLTVRGTVLVRAKEGGFYMASLEKKRDGTWFVRCGAAKLDLMFCDTRKRWVVKQLP